MNVKEYISSGIVESYVLGLVNEPDRQEFEAQCAQYSEVAQAKETFERALENALVQDSVPPPAHLKESIRLSLFPADQSYPLHNTEEGQAPVRTMNTWKWLAAASVVLLAGSLYWGVTANNKYNEVKGLVQENQQLKNQLSEASAQLAEVKVSASALQQPDVKMASLKGTAVSPASYVTVYWDTTSKDVYLMVNNLPQPASGKQYQLWALINNKPVDLGVLQMSAEKLIPMVQMKGVQNAEAFAITLEPTGGSVGPTMEQMYVVGKL